MAERKDTTIVLQSGLNVINGGNNQVEFYGFIPIYDDLIDPNVMVNPLDPIDSVSEETINKNITTLHDFDGAFYFNTGSKYKFMEERGYAYCSSADGYADIQGYAPATNDGYALKCGGNTNSLKNAYIESGHVQFEEYWSQAAVSGWTAENVWRNILPIREVTNDDNVKFKQYTATVNAVETGDIMFNKLLIFVSGSSGLAPIAMIALAHPVTVYENSSEDGSFSSFSVMFSIGFTANLEQIPVHIVGETSGYWGYAEKNEEVDYNNPIAYPGRLYIGNMADHSTTDVSAFITMSGKQTSGLQYVDYFTDEDSAITSYRKVDGSVVNISGSLPTSGVDNSLLVGISSDRIDKVKNSLASVYKPTYSSLDNAVLTNPVTGELTTAHTVDSDRSTSSWGGWNFTEEDVAEFAKKIDNSICNIKSNSDETKHIIGIKNSIVNVNPRHNQQPFSGLLALDSVVVGRSWPQCENSIFVGSLNVSSQYRIPFLSNSVVVGKNNLIIRTSTTKTSENKKGHYFRTEKPIVILGNNNSISANNNTIGAGEYSAYVFGSGISATFDSYGCSNPKYIFGNDYTVEMATTTGATGISYMFDPILQVGTSNTKMIFGDLSEVAAQVTKHYSYIKFENLPSTSAHLPSGSLYTVTENGKKYVCIK